MVKTNNKKKVIAIGVTCIMAWIFSFLATNIFKEYAVGLFIWLPMIMGATSTLIYGYKNDVPKNRLFYVSLNSLIIFCVGLLFFAWEGIICLFMAMPIALLFMYIGHVIAYEILIKKNWNSPATIILLILSVPSLMAFESNNTNEDKVRSVSTSIEINASPEQVWRNVIAFPELAEPTEFIFKTGIAYPIDATINGNGVGAIRHCNFSTGSFVEPITIWYEPTLLKFSVVEQPEPMKEISPYNIHPNHLHGFWVSKEGQFKLTKLANGNTLLEGTTWYVNKIKPGIYWSIWSDYIVHKIHQRVLKHIKQVVETE